MPVALSVRSSWSPLLTINAAVAGRSTVNWTWRRSRVASNGDTAALTEPNKRLSIVKPGSTVEGAEASIGWFERALAVFGCGSYPEAAGEGEASGNIGLLGAAFSGGLLMAGTASPALADAATSGWSESLAVRRDTIIAPGVGAIPVLATTAGMPGGFGTKADKASGFGEAAASGIAAARLCKSVPCEWGSSASTIATPVEPPAISNAGEIASRMGGGTAAGPTLGPIADCAGRAAAVAMSTAVTSAWGELIASALCSNCPDDVTRTEAFGTVTSGRGGCELVTVNGPVSACFRSAAAFWTRTFVTLDRAGRTVVVTGDKPIVVTGEAAVIRVLDAMLPGASAGVVASDVVACTPAPVERGLGSTPRPPVEAAASRSINGSVERGALAAAAGSLDAVTLPAAAVGTLARRPAAIAVSAGAGVAAITGQAFAQADRCRRLVRSPKRVFQPGAGQHVQRPRLPYGRGRRYATLLPDEQLPLRAVCAAVPPPAAARCE